MSRYAYRLVRLIRKVRALTGRCDPVSRILFGSFTATGPCSMHVNALTAAFLIHYATFIDLRNTTMVEVARTASISPFLKDAWSIVTTASHLCQTVKYRHNQLDLLLARYDVKAQAEGIEEACESTRNIIETVHKKGLLWCLVNAGKLNIRIQDHTYRLPQTIAQENRLRQMIRALDADQQNMSQILRSSRDNKQFVRTFKAQETITRTGDEITIALLKASDARASITLDDSLPEDVFIHDASKILCQWHAMEEIIPFAPFVMSSVEVEIDLDVRLGRGPSGEVYKAYWEGSLVAVKRLHLDNAELISDDYRKGFRHEVKTWSDLHHPNIVRLFGACLETEVPFLVMQLCRYGTITNYLLEYPDANRTQLAFEVAKGLAFLHRQGLVHADVKTANVLIGEDQHALLSDFGLAMKLHQYRGQSAFSAEMDRRRGTPIFLAPEVLLAKTLPDMRSDVYSFGLTIWEVFSDSPPYQNYLTMEHLTEGVAKNRHRPSCPQRLKEGDRVWEVIKRCWHADPRARPSMQEVQDALTPAEDRNAPAARPRGVFSDPNVFARTTAFYSSSVGTSGSRGVYATASVNQTGVSITPGGNNVEQEGSSVHPVEMETSRTRPVTTPVDAQSHVPGYPAASSIVSWDSLDNVSYLEPSDHSAAHMTVRIFKLILALTHTTPASIAGCDVSATNEMLSKVQSRTGHIRIFKLKSEALKATDPDVSTGRHDHYDGGLPSAYDDMRWLS
ncbi:hypothetical protein NM688_g2521 [Phlebia brevispora]|uniref:Uncharacterized protein n=1 Tax=Phlebia brevispora TaxID=194682 RepID=A0ACC1T8M7_9APHY|nr:hypothetical protein NM688_g2521 [Phlebia brevispora]